MVLLSTKFKATENVMSMSWHTMLEFVPPLIGCVVSNRDYTFDLLKKSKECVINIPSFDMAKQVVGCGNYSGKKVDKFKKFKLTKSAAAKVEAPLIDECFANLECKLIDSSLVNKYNFFILKVVKAWISTNAKNPKTLHHLGRGVFAVPGKVIKLNFNKK